MYLSRLILNPRSRAVQRDLADCQGLHRTVMSLFEQVAGKPARAALDILYRLETDSRQGRVVLLVQSAAPPDCSRLESGFLAEVEGPNPVSKPVDSQYGAISTGDHLRFRLVANPTKKIDTRSGPDGERRNGQRVPVRGEEAQLAWLARKGEGCGFRLRQARVNPASVERSTVPAAQASPGPEKKGWHPGDDGKKMELSFTAITFDGELVVTDANAFRLALLGGIGPGKAYGFGLLSVAPA
ncbi:MAG: type I-E CRISPR-associated protein Cas6/Cse3/CasE [Chloroflexota bacterium]